MFNVREKPKIVEKALVAGVCFKGEDLEEAESLLSELEDLVGTLGIPVQGRMLVTSSKPKPKFLMGEQRANEVVAKAKQCGADVIVIDKDLSPAQQRSWERLSSLCVIDREEVILDIFGKRALSREARLQVDLARMVYSLPRLTRAWAHLSRQSGGGGTGGRGEGETQLETDRRIVRRRINRLKHELVTVRKQRATQRKQRQKIPLPHAAIVGYTNGGKSSLLRCMTGADVRVENKLFATLDTTTRKIRLPDGQRLLLTDTVGFVRKLPHDLVEAFKATLEEAVLADFRIHLLDVSHPKVLDFHQTTLDVLEELGADTNRMLTVFNKMDKISDPSQVIYLRNLYPNAVFISVKTGEGQDQLIHRLADMINDLVVDIQYRFPVVRSDLVSSIHQCGKVISTKYEKDETVFVRAIVPSRVRGRYLKFEIMQPAEEEESDQPSPESLIASDKNLHHESNPSE